MVEQIEGKWFSDSGQEHYIEALNDKKLKVTSSFSSNDLPVYSGQILTMSTDNEQLFEKRLEYSKLTLEIIDNETVLLKNKTKEEKIFKVVK